MRETIIADLSLTFPRYLVEELFESYEHLLSKHRIGDLEGALAKAGRFVENVLRAIEFVRTGSVPPEIKSVQQAVHRIENDVSISESLRLLIPRVANGMIYGLRSKRNAVHVKEIDPSAIDVSLTVSAAGWVLAELLRIYHGSNDHAVQQAMLALTRTTVPLIEAIDGEVFVGRNVPAAKELLLLLAHSRPGGMTRRELGLAAKCSQPSVTASLQALGKARLIHQAASGTYFITTNGEQSLADWLVATVRQAA